MKLLKLPHLYFTLTLTGCLLLSMPPAAQGFITEEHRLGHQLNVMINKVHRQHWVIGYRYGDKCTPEERDNDAALTAAITKALQIWLQPLRDYAQRPIVNDFRYRLNTDRHASDLAITFFCKRDRLSAALMNVHLSPLIHMNKGKRVGLTFIGILVHEMGHAFGLADTYLRKEDRGNPELDKGGRDSTKGTQPASMMAVSPPDVGNGKWLGRDDKVGIVWLYKRRYEGLGLRDCVFPDYELEEDPLGCRPKYPLIFAVKHARWQIAGLVLHDDPGLDVNARDADGMTALHHAVLRKYKWFIQALMQRDDINPSLKNNDGQTPLQLATKLGLDAIAALIHPKAMAVDAKRTLTTTWGALKTGK